MNRSMYLRRCRKIALEPGRGQLEPAQLAALQKNLESLGFVLSPALCERVLSLEPDALSRFYRQLIEDLRGLVGAHGPFQPMYPNFPEQVRDTSEAELYFNALLHYWGDAIGQRILPRFGIKPRGALQDLVALKPIELGSKQDFNALFTRLVSAKASLSETDREDLEWFVKNRGDAILALLPESIPQRETLALIGALLLRHSTVAEAFLAQHLSTATDVLRLAAALSGGDISLAAPTKFISFPKRQRRLLLSLLEAIPAPAEDMLRRPEAWKRLGERLHPHQYLARYPKACAAFDIVRNALPYETFNSRLEAALATADTASALALLRTRPGELARRLDQLLRQASDPSPVLAAFGVVAARVATPLLLQVMTHFIHRPEPLDLRVFFPKGDVAKLRAVANTLPALDPALCGRVAGVCREALLSRYGEKSALGRVWIDPGLKKYTVPFARRSAAKALRTIARGSRLALPAGDTLRCFIWWKDGSARTDLDLSALALKDDHGYHSAIAYYNLRELGGCHSGDITSAPAGASEFIDLHIPSCRAAGIRYLLMVVNSFTRQAYCDLPQCFAGIMLRQYPGSGEIYEPATVADRFDLSANATIAIPLILDLEARELLWTDLSLSRNPSANNNVHNNLSSLTILSRAMQSLRKPSLFDLFSLHAAARGELVSDEAEADTVFAVDRGIRPLDSERILAEFL